MIATATAIAKRSWGTEQTFVVSDLSSLEPLTGPLSLEPYPVSFIRSNSSSVKIAHSCQTPERKDSLGPVCAQRNCVICSSRTDLPFYLYISEVHSATFHKVLFQPRLGNVWFHQRISVLKSDLTPRSVANNYLTHFLKN
jgi:hypothetical protein